MKAKRVSTGMRLSELAKQQLEELAGRAGISQTAIIETLIREKAKAEGVSDRLNPARETAEIPA